MNKKNVKINWMNFIILLGNLNGDFDIEPLEYLKFAKLDYREGTTKGLVNALGYDYKKFDEYNAYKDTKRFIKENFENSECDGLTERIKLIEILEIAPVFLISKIRTLRNKVEHEYTLPTKEEVKEAIEISELFINSSMRKFSLTPSGIEFGNEKNKRLDIKVDFDFFQFINNYISL